MNPATSGASVVKRGETRRGKPLDIFGDNIYIKMGSVETNGRYSLIEDVTPPGGGPPLHVHHREDEGFYILEGEYLFQTGEARHKVGPGDFVYIPRDIPHCFKNIGGTTGTMLLTLEPGGLEVFFAELSAVSGPPTPEKVAPIFVKYGLELLGPPLADE